MSSKDLTTLINKEITKGELIALINKYFDNDSDIVARISTFEITTTEKDFTITTATFKKNLLQDF